MPEDSGSQSVSQDNRTDQMLSLRTMTSIICNIQKHFQVGYAVNQLKVDIASGLVSHYYEEPLRALTAFATLLVRDTEVVAMAVNRRGPLSFIACTSNTESDEADDTPPFYPGRSFLAARNPRDDQPFTDTNDVIVLEPQHEAFDVRDPVTYLLQHW